MSASDRHIQLQNMAVRWIGDRSFKKCSLVECGAVGYSADLVTIAGMHDSQHTKYTKHSGLTKRYMSSRLTGEGIIRQTFGDVDRWYVCVFEIKVSRADFLNTFGDRESPHAKARMKPAGTAHWIVAEKGVCKPEELPDFWGLLTPYGTGLTELKMPKLHILPDSELHAIAFDMLWLQQNGRSSYYARLINMSEKVKVLHRAIVKQEPTEKLLKLSHRVIGASRGFVF